MQKQDISTVNYMSPKKAAVKQGKQVHMWMDGRMDGCVYLDRGCGPRGWMAADLAAILIGSLFVVELQLLGCAAMVVPHRINLLSRGLT